MRQKINFAAVGIFCGLITYFSVYQPGSTVRGYANLSTLAHILAYFGLSAVLMLHFHPTKHGIIESIVLASTVGLGVELIQFQLPYRSFSRSDVLFNTLGASLIVFDYQGFAADKIVALEDKILENIPVISEIV